MLEHAIIYTTYEGDIVLDCFAGSGSTAVAALKNNRRSISVEIDEQWISQIEHVLKNLEGLSVDEYPNNYNSPLFDMDQEQIKLEF